MSVEVAEVEVVEAVEVVEVEVGGNCGEDGGVGG